jgi:hypothetical protein
MAYPRPATLRQRLRIRQRAPESDLGEIVQDVQALWSFLKATRRT